MEEIDQIQPNKKEQSQGFQTRFSLFVSELPPDKQQFLLKYLSFEIPKQRLFLDASERLFDDSLIIISEILNLIKSLDFQDVQLLDISFDSPYDICMHVTQLEEIRITLQNLQNLKRIKIVEQCNKVWNPITMFIFFYFEMPHDFENFFYESQTIEGQNMKINQISQKNQVTLCFNIKYWFLNGNSSILSDLSSLFNEVYSLKQQTLQFKSDNNDNQVSDEMVSFKSQQNKKDIEINLDLGILDIPSVIHTSLSLIKLWNYDRSMISRIFLTLSMNIPNDKFYFGSQQKEQKGNNIIDMKQLSEIEVVSQLSLRYPLLNNKSHIVLFMQLIRYLKGIFVSLQWQGQEEQLRSILKELKSESMEKGFMLDNLQMLWMGSVKCECVKYVLLIQQFFPRLEKLFINAGDVDLHAQLLPSIKEIVQSLSRLDKFEIADRIIFKESRLQFILKTESQEYSTFGERIQEAIEVIGKPVHLLLQLSQRKVRKSNLIKTIQLVRKIIVECKTQVADFKIESTIPFPDLEQLISERTSFILSIIAFTNLIKDFMVYHPIIIISDLFDF